MLGMMLSRLEGKLASCRFSTAGAESHATDAVAFVAALLASQFMLLVTCQKKCRNRDSRDLQSHDVPRESMRSMHHDFFFKTVGQIL